MAGTEEVRAGRGAAVGVGSSPIPQYDGAEGGGQDGEGDDSWMEDRGGGQGQLEEDKDKDTEIVELCPIYHQLHLGN